MRTVPLTFVYSGTEVLLEAGAVFSPSIPPRGLGNLGNWREASDTDFNSKQLPSRLCVHLARKEAINCYGEQVGQAPSVLSRAPGQDFPLAPPCSS